MLIKTLVENTSQVQEIGTEHGLSLYIETKRHKLLFDLGASDLFLTNAEKMGVDLSAVDLAVISHGHHDHGGGLKAFLAANARARIYIRRNAFDRHLANRPGGEQKYVGLDRELLPNPRFVFTDDSLRLDDELELYSNITGDKLKSEGNKDLLTDPGTGPVQDDFSHEQNLVITEDGRTVLIAGCAHRGIVNIVSHLRPRLNRPLTHILGGFHLYNPNNEKYEDAALIAQIGAFLKDTGARCFTGHCTGMEAYKKLREAMGEQIQYLSAGSTLMI